MFRTAGTGSGGAVKTRQIKDWVRELLAPDDAVTILVSELTCREPGCPPVETVIALLRSREDTRKFTIHRAAAEVTREDIAALGRADGQGT
jgi:hypothetical protein